MNVKNKILLFVVQTYQKRKRVPKIEISRDNDQKKTDPPHMDMSQDNDRKRKESPFRETSLDIGQNNAFRPNELQLQNPSSNFVFQIESIFFSFTHGLQHHCFLGHFNLYRLCGLWQL